MVADPKYPEGLIPIPSPMSRGKIGEPKFFGEMLPTNNLRWLSRKGYPMILQQEWSSMGVDGHGYVCEGEREWRNVPVVTAEEGVVERKSNDAQGS